MNTCHNSGAKATGRAWRTGKSVRGFTLVEFGIVMLIMGLLMGAILQFFNSYRVQQSLKTTNDNITSDASMISLFRGLAGGRYPCPADPSLPQTDLKYGKENCSLSGQPVGTCTGAGNTGVCKVEDPATGRTALTGMFPFKTINENPAVELTYAEGQQVYDGWGRRLTYMVTEAMTSPGTFEDRLGAIVSNDEQGINTAIDGIHYALISHGANGYGAYNSDGKVVVACSDPRVSVLEQENCNADAIIVKPMLRSYAAGPNEMDDIVDYRVQIDSALWDANDCVSPFGGKCLHNTNPGFVGIGVPSGAPLANSLEVDNGDVHAVSVISDLICDNSNNCFPAAAIAGSSTDVTHPGGMVCPQTGLAAGEVRVATGIKNGAPICNKIITPTVTIPTGTARSCPVVGGKQQLLVGFTPAGALKCASVY